MKFATLGLAIMLIAQQDGCAIVDNAQKAAELKRKADEALEAARIARAELTAERQALRRLYTED